MDVNSVFIIGTGLEIALIVGGLAISALAGLILQPKSPRNPNTRNNTAPTLAERGAFIPYVLGTARVGALVAWMGKGKTTKKEDGGILGFGTTKTKITTQQAWHIICVGPVSKLIHIYEQGRLIFPFKGEPPLTPESHPSGTLVKLKSKAGSFRIYWGENDQPGDPLLAGSGKYAGKGLGVASNWPNICYVVWDTKKLEIANQWPQIDYEVEVHCLQKQLFFSEDFMEGTVIGGDGPFYENNGVNPAHALKQILCEQYPHGIGIDPSLICGKFLEDMGAALEDEEQPCNIVVQNGDDALNPISAILSDCGAILPQCGGLIVPFLIRNQTTDIPEIEDDVVAPSLPEKEFLFGEKSTDRLIFVFKDRLLNFRDGDVTIDNDSSPVGRPKPTTIELNTVIDKLVAARIANRRQQEDFASVRTYKLFATRGARVFQPGQVLKHSRIGQVRVTSIIRQDDSPLVTIECVSDVYAPVAGSYVPPDPGTTDPGLEGDPVADIFDWIEAPPPLTDGRAGIIVLRARGSEDAIGALINLSRDNISYINNSTIEAFFLTGTLNEAMPFSFPAQSIEGVVITCSSSLQFDNDIFADLTLETTRWRTGEQVLVVDNEICFFRKLTPLTTANQYRVEGLIRGRLGSLQVAHSASARVWLGQQTDLVRIYDSLITRGTLYVQSLPVAGDLVLDPADTAPINHTIVGTSLAPYPPATFRAEDGAGIHRNTFATGGDVNFAWNNRSRFGGGATAGTQLAGIAISTPPGMDGQLILNIKTTLGVVVRSVTVSSGTSYVYPNATMVSDFGSEPTAFDVTFFQIDGSFPSREDTIRITRR